MKIKKIILGILVIAWMIVIFMFSQQNAVNSQNTSDKVSEKIVDTAAAITNKEITKQERKNIVKDIRFIARKTAHFTLYFVLGILVYLLLNECNVSKKIILSLITCIIYATSDELHQLFINQRTAKVFDVFIDTLGSLAGIILCNLVKLVVAKIKKNAIIDGNLGG